MQTFWLDTGYGCGALEIDKGVVIGGAPIFKWMKGNTLIYVTDYLKKKNQLKGIVELKDKQVQTIDSFTGRYAFLSNFFLYPFQDEGIIYRTVEHYFQALKTLDHYDFYRIVNCGKPGEAKRLGRKVQLRAGWEGMKIQVMKYALWLKFSDLTMRKRLMDTGDSVLIEGNHWHDNFWGNCSCRQCAHIIGQNHLGILLMEVRGELWALR